MRLAPTDVVAGYPAKEMRERLRILRDRADRARGLTPENIGVIFDVDDPKALMRKLKTAGLIEPEPDRKGRWRTTIRGNALCIVKFGKPVTRAKAQDALDGFMERVEAVNQRGSGWRLGVRQVVLFGSFLDPASELVGDVDLSVEAFGRWPSGGDLDKHIEQIETFCEARGYHPKSYTDMLGYPERAVQSYLKGRSPIISMSWRHGNQAEALGVEYKVLYEHEPFEDVM